MVFWFVLCVVFFGGGVDCVMCYYFGQIEFLLQYGVGIEEDGKCMWVWLGVGDQFVVLFVMWVEYVFGWY